MTKPASHGEPIEKETANVLAEKIEHLKEI
jgi:hypothetical protein